MEGHEEEHTRPSGAVGGQDEAEEEEEEQVPEERELEALVGSMNVREDDDGEEEADDEELMEYDLSHLVQVESRVPETESTIYSILPYRMEFHIPDRYSAPTGAVAVGAYACVAFARDQERPPTPTGKFESHQQQVAIKKLRRFADADEAVRAYRELLILRHLRKPGQHENIVTLRDYFLLPAEDSILDHYIVTEYCGYTLDQQFPYLENTADFQSIAYGVLCGVKYIHSAGLAHRDLKPNNIVVDLDALTVKIIDFGYAKRDRARFPYMHAYMQCRDYRAPELFLWLQAADQAEESPVHISGQQLDMWSVGVIITEMMLGRPLFPAIPSQAGLEVQHNSHMCRLFNHIGPPSPSYFEQFPQSRARSTLVNYASRVHSQYLWDELGEMAQQNADDECWANIVPLSKALLSYDERPTAEQVLAMPFFGQLRDPEDEPSHPEVFDDSFEVERAGADVAFWVQRLQDLAQQMQQERS